jgi:hypothetical protein
MKTQYTINNSESRSSSFYPRIIREFEDERDEQPMYYGASA